MDQGKGLYNNQVVLGCLKNQAFMVHHTFDHTG